MKRALVLFLILGATAATQAEIIDRIAAIVDGRVITLSEVERWSTLRLLSPREGDTTVDYQRRTLDVMINMILQRRDAERFGVQQVSDEAIQARIDSISAKYASKDEFQARMRDVGLSEQELHDAVRVRLQLEAYVSERFAPLIFIPLEDIERYYESSWSQQRRAQGLDVPPLSEVREQIREMLRAEQLQREVDRWTEQLRNRANVDIYVYR